MGLILGWGSLQLCQSLVNELYCSSDSGRKELSHRIQANGKSTSLWVGPLADVVVPIGNIQSGLYK